MNKKALLIIDMQNGSFTAKTPRYDTEGVVSRINALARRFRHLQDPVIFIQHDGSGTDEFIPGTKTWALLDSLETYASDLCINKYANDVFYNSNLKPILDTLGLDTLYITGCATDFCVAATIQSAITKDYNLTIVADGHTTGERPNLNAKQVIDHYNWVWKNMIPTKGQVTVKDFKGIMQSL
ncbi:isochorismatase family protein [Algibacter mikhailovii]|uniref:Isochorismatase n=1 Tax=Algibacter mikhailovii TaxID=425498 RepID=A0A918R966_9FLAO|nr:isochorismatase family protein [Algibacter mikhailovii]GGZ90350.1 isochorismatase [Algibacter mikhailovii]